jgi:tetratricopeptide (TPR) repeat protein
MTPWLLVVSTLSSQVAVPTTVDVRGGFSVPPPAGLEAVLVAEATGGRLSRMDLATAALLASGVPEPELPRARQVLLAAVQPSVERALRRTTPADRGRTLLAALHETVLRRYDAGATQVTRVVNGGEFNCVSSSVVFVVAAEGVLGDPRAVLMDSHAFARVTAGNRAVDVETTTPGGFDPDRKRLWTPAFLSRLGIRQGLDGRAPDLQAEYARAVELPSVALVAAIYGNRAVDLLEQGDARGAAVALDRATRMAHGPQKARLAEWRATLLANAAVDLVEAGRVQDAIPLLHVGLQDLSGKRRDLLTGNLAIAYGRLADQLLEQGEPAEALRWLDAAAALGKWDWLTQRRAHVLGAVGAREGSTDRCEGRDAPPGTPAAVSAAECLGQVSDGLLAKNDVDGAVAASRRAVALAPKVKNARIAAWNSLNARAAARAARDRCDLAEQDWREAEPFRDVSAGGGASLPATLAGCWGAQATRAQQAGRHVDAEAWLVRALGHQPGDAALRHNLAVSLVTRARPLAESGQCDDARGLVGRAVAQDGKLRGHGSSLLARCAYHRAMTPWNQKRWPEAVVELRRGLRDAPDNQDLKTNLAAALHNHAGRLVEAGDCPEARALLQEARKLGLAPEQADKAAQGCAVGP